MSQELVYVERKGSNSRKWDGLKERFSKDDLLPLWIADMDFAIPKKAREDIVKFVSNAALGYYKEDDDYYNSFIAFEKKYYGIDIKKEWIRFSPGVVCAINWIIQMLTNENDNIMTFVPIYYPFMEAIKNNKRKLIKNNLIYTVEGVSINFNDVEKSIIDNNVKMFILCSPHNPLGRVWKKEELVKLLDICKRNKVYVISDEIHHNILFGNNVHTSVLMLKKYDNIAFTLMSASKTFNIAGLKNSFVIIKNKKMRNMYDEYYSKLRINGGNSISYVASTSCYKYGKPWLDEVLNVIEKNYKYMRNHLQNKFPKIVIPELQGTYLMWLDLNYYLRNKISIKSFMEKECKIAIDYGEWFGHVKYRNCVRINLATSEENIRKATDNIEKALNNIQNQT